MSVVKDSFISSTSSSYSFNNVAGDLLIVGVISDDGTVNPTAITYNSISLTKAIGAKQGDLQSSIWYLINPATGSNTLAITGVSNFSACQSVSGADQTTPVADTDVTEVTSGTSWSNTVTAATNGSYALATVHITSSPNTAITAGANTTQIVANNDMEKMFDSSGFGDISTGDFTFNWTKGFNANDIATTTVIISEAAATSTIKTRNTVAIANVKTANTVT